MELRDLIIIVIIGIIIYYLYTILNKKPVIPITETKKQENIEGEDQVEVVKEIDIIEPTPYYDPYVVPFYDPYIYPYWDPYDLYPYGIYGVDYGADWNSNYIISRGRKRYPHKYPHKYPSKYPSKYPPKPSKPISSKPSKH